MAAIRGQNVRQLRPSTASGQALADAVIEREQPDWILLMDHQVAERGRKADRVVELGQFLAVRVAHALGQIDRQVARDVGLSLVLLNVVPVGFSVDQPIDVFGVVPLRIAAVLAELDAESVKRTGVKATQKPFDNEPCPKIETGHGPNNFGFEILFGRTHGDPIAAESFDRPGMT
jgi:hypothetical protein